MKDIKGYEGLYRATESGEIISVKTGSALKPYENTGGYLRVNLCKDGKMAHKYVHRLIAETFLPNPGSCPEVDHLNADRKDNRVVNLRWCSRHGNVESALAMGHWSHSVRVKATNTQSGEVLIFAFLKHASRHIFGNSHSLQYCRKRYGNRFTKAGWIFEVVQDGIQTA